MEIRFTWDKTAYRADLSKPIDISIPLRNGAHNQPNAYGAPPFEATPVVEGDFVGSIEAGSPVNFFNIAINPHGNGTHTECVGHILQGPYFIRECLRQSHCVAEVISVDSSAVSGKREISEVHLSAVVRHKAEALIVRTLPNPTEKMHRRYTGTNPPYFSAEAMEWVREEGYNHFLTDLPSLDPEVDGGALAAHKAFWNVEGEVRKGATITEMIFMSESFPDGLYLLDVHNLALDLDVSPSRPMLFVMERE